MGLIKKTTRVLKILIVTSVLLLNIGCSTMKNRTVMAGVTSFAVCSLIGANASPEDENKNMHGALYGGLCSTAAMMISEIIDSSPKDKEIIELKSRLLKEEALEVDIRTEVLSSPSIKNLDQSVQDSLKGKWDVYKKSDWIFDGEKLNHENMEIRFKD